MADDISDIAALYNHDVELEDARLAIHQLEYDLTWRYLTKYLPPSGSILEIGAGPGRYTLALCRRGYTVTAVDVSEGLLERCQQRLAAEHLDGQVQHIVADARDLHALSTKMFDAVLLMGPLYHLIFEEDRQIAIREAAARLRSGGMFFSAFLSRVGIIGDLMKRVPEWIEQHQEVRSLIEKGTRSEEAPRGGFRGYFARTSEIRPLHEALGIQTVVLAGVEPAISADDDSYNTLQPSLRERWLDLLFEVSADVSMVGASRHLLYVGQKLNGDTPV